MNKEMMYEYKKGLVMKRKVESDNMNRLWDKKAKPSDVNEWLRYLEIYDECSIYELKMKIGLNMYYAFNWYNSGESGKGREYIYDDEIRNNYLYTKKKEQYKNLLQKPPRKYRHQSYYET